MSIAANVCILWGSSLNSEVFQEKIHDVCDKKFAQTLRKKILPRARCAVFSSARTTTCVASLLVDVAEAVTSPAIHPGDVLADG